MRFIVLPLVEGGRVMIDAERVAAGASEDGDTTVLAYYDPQSESWKDLAIALDLQDVSAQLNGALYAGAARR